MPFFRLLIGIMGFALACAFSMPALGQNSPRRTEPGRTEPGQPESGQRPRVQGRTAQKSSGQQASGQKVQGTRQGSAAGNAQNRQANSGAAAKGGKAPAAPRQPAAPFRLSPAQQAELDRVLAAWDARNKKIKTFRCVFTLWEYDANFGLVDKQTGQVVPTQRQGVMKYATPDKGLYWVTHVLAKNEWQEQHSEHWVCDGKSIFEFNYQKEQLVEYPLPQEMQGQAIQDGPLPFVFGSTGDKLRHRYFLRTMPPPQGVEGQIWLEAFPRFRVDAANFVKATLILKADEMLPYALEFELPGGNRKAYQFDESVVNDRWEFIKPSFAVPRLPRGWKKVVENTAAAPPPPAKAEQPSAAQPQARKPARNLLRR